MKDKESNTNGLNILIKDVKSYSQTQAAYRFYNNDNVDIDSLNAPIMENGLQNIEKECNEYILVAHDWSLINYRNHTAKEDCIITKRSNTKKAISKGYDLQTSLAISDITGEPITPLVQNLKTNNKVLSTYNSEIDMNETHLSELSSRIKYINKDMNINKKKVHIIDREADSALLLREIEDEDYHIIRAIDRRLVEYNGENILQKDLADKIDLGKEVKDIKYEKKKVKIYVNSVNVKITRKSYLKDENQKRIFKTGKSINRRLVIERLVDDENNIIATWLLLTNLKEDVSDEKVALWYYYRWKIESYFKLLKSSGFNIEKWQQESAGAIFKRLLVVAFAVVLVWEIEHSNTKKMLELKEFLLKISGRLVKRNKSSSSALLAGIWTFLSTIDIIELYDIKKLTDMKRELNDLLSFKF